MSCRRHCQECALAFHSWLLVGIGMGATFLVGCPRDTAAPAKSKGITVAASHQACADDSDCIEVKRDCAGCFSCGFPVNGQWATHYQRAVAKTCGDGQDDLCDAEPCPRKLLCQSKVCAWQSRDAVED